MKETFDAIDIAKFVASILIFSMHCNIFGEYSFFLEVTARWGVPFFFICSGYFLFSKSENGKITKETLIRYIRRLGMLYLVWFVINFPNVFFKHLYSKKILDNRTWLFFLKNSILSSTFTASWFLGSSIFSAWIIYILGKKLKTTAMIAVASILYVLCVFSSVYRGVLPSEAYQVLKFLSFPLNIFNGCIYFAVGKYIYENKQFAFKIFVKKRAFLIFILFYYTYIVELCLAKYYNFFGSTDVAFSTIGIALPLFLLCLQSNIKIKNGILLRKLSTIIFCCQGNVLLVNGFLKKIVKVPSIVSYLISAMIVTFICCAVLYIQKKKQWNWSKYLT